jgi:hypothetical protein
MRGVGQEAHRLGTKPPEAILGNEIVQPVPQYAGDDSNEERERPGESQVGEHPYGPVGFEIGLTIFKQDIGLEVHGIQPQVPEKRLTQRRLRSREAE